MAKKMKKSLLFVGQKGEHITGYPARDLSAAEVGRLTTKEIDRLIGTGLYQWSKGDEAA